MNPITGSVFSASAAFIVALFIIPFVMRLSARRGWYDEPDERKIHNGPIPRLGGIGLFWGFALAILAGYALGLLPGRDYLDGYFWTVALGGMIIHGIGLLDDFTDLRARVKFAVQLFLAIALVAYGFRFHVVKLPFIPGELDLGAFSWPLSVIWIVGVTNAVNLIDGMDGLAGGIASIASIVFGVIFFHAGNLPAAFVCCALFGATLGFLVFNFPPAKIFMGDSGSLSLGFILAILPLLGPARGKIEIGLVSASTMLLVPILDTMTAIIRRFRAGVPFFSPDRRHLHHKLLAMGLSTRHALFVVYGATFLLGAATLSPLFLSEALSFWLRIGSWFVVVGLFLFLHLRSPVTLQGQTISN